MSTTTTTRYHSALVNHPAMYQAPGTHSTLKPPGSTHNHHSESGTKTTHYCTDAPSVTQTVTRCTKSRPTRSHSTLVTTTTSTNNVGLAIRASVYTGSRRPPLDTDEALLCGSRGRPQSAATGVSGVCACLRLRRVRAKANGRPIGVHHCTAPMTALS